MVVVRVRLPTGPFMKKEDTHICPKCGSTNAKEVIGLRYTPTARKCLDCDYIGIFPIIPKNKIKEFQKKIKR